MGVGRGGTVGVCLDRGADILAVLLGVLSAGAADLPLDGRYRAARLGFMVRDAGASCVVADPAYAAALADVAVPVVAPADLYLPGAAPESASAPDDLAYVLYTSGSTRWNRSRAATRASRTRERGAREAATTASGRDGATRISVVDALPVTANGKVDRGALQRHEVAVRPDARPAAAGAATA